MAYNTTVQEQEDAAERDTRKKIEQEAIFTAALLRGYFGPLSKTAFNHYEKFGNFPNLQKHQDDLQKILNQQYSDTAQKFIRQVREALGRPENAADLNSLINDANGVQQSVNTFNSGRFITDTTGKDLNRTVNEILVAAALAGITLTNRQVSKQAKRKFDDLSASRAPLISMTETQQSAEGSKYTEANILQKNSAIFPIAKVALARDKMTKKWITKMDNRVRAAHVKAEGQKKDFEKPYVVGGELLKRPRDTSLGATAGNVINCRCASVVTIRRAARAPRQFTELDQ